MYLVTYNLGMSTKSQPEFVPLTPEQKQEVKRRYDTQEPPVTVASLATEFKVSKREIRKALGKVMVSPVRGVKLDWDKVSQIRARWEASEAGLGPKLSKRALGLEYGVHSVNIHYIVTGRTWKIGGKGES